MEGREKERKRANGKIEKQSDALRNTRNCGRLYAAECYSSFVHQSANHFTTRFTCIGTSCKAVRFPCLVETHQFRNVWVIRVSSYTLDAIVCVPHTLACNYGGFTTPSHCCAYMQRIWFSCMYGYMRTHTRLPLALNTKHDVESESVGISFRSYDWRIYSTRTYRNDRTRIRWIDFNWNQFSVYIINNFIKRELALIAPFLPS